jgi:hypothetical protein
MPMTASPFARSHPRRHRPRNVSNGDAPPSRRLISPAKLGCDDSYGWLSEYRERITNKSRLISQFAVALKSSLDLFDGRVKSVLRTLAGGFGRGSNQLR